MQQRIVELLDKVANEEVTSKISKERSFLFSCFKNFTVQDMSMYLLRMVLMTPYSVRNIFLPGELLRVNDDLNNAFLRYERFERYRTGQTGQVPQTQTSPVINAATLVSICVQNQYNMIL